MSPLDRSAGRRILLVTGGHRVDLDAMLAMLGQICADRDWVLAHAVQPAAQGWLRPREVGRWDAILCHDIPGLRLARGSEPVADGPDAATAADLIALLEQGQGLVVTHHSLAGWPDWPGWGQALGGRFRYAPGHGDPSSGTLLTTYLARPVATHPVCAGVTPFTLDDELYCCPVEEDLVVPLVRHDGPTDGESYVSTFEHVLHGAAAAPSCAGQRASDLLAWATVAGRSPLVYLQPGDGPGTFAAAGYRRLVGNALDWVGSRPAHGWAAANPRPIASPLQSVSL